MKALWIRLVLTLAVLTFGRSLFAVYVIPYELRIDNETYTVLVILADHYDHHFGEPDGLTKMLSQNFHADPKSFASPYLHIPHEWYLGKLAEHPKIYGADVAKLVETLRQFQPINTGIASGVIITEHNQIDKVLTFLRIETAGKDGKLVSERTVLEGGQFPTPKDVFRWTSVSDFRADSYVEGIFPIGFPAETRMHYWLEGENIEFKNFGSENLRKFLKYLHFIARAHKLYHWGASLFPERETAFPDGTPIPKEAQSSWGKRVSHVWLMAMSATMVKLYEGMGFSVWDVANNEATGFKDLFAMRATPEEIDGKLEATLLTPDQKDLLVFDRGLTTTLKSFDCRQVYSVTGEAASVEHLRKIIIP